METKHKSEVQLAADELVEKFKPHDDWNNEYGSCEIQANIKYSIKCAIQAQQMVIDRILLLNDIFIKSNNEGAAQMMYLEISYQQEILTELKSRL